MLEQDVRRRVRPARSDVASAVDQAMGRVRASGVLYVEGARRRALALDPRAAQLWADLGDQVGGKMLRPRLTLAAYLGLGGDDLDAVVPVALAQEILHTAMLVHDDVLDHDDVRRGRPNIAGATRARLAAEGVAPEVARAQGDAAALLGGDLAIAAAVDVVLRAPLAPAVATEVVGLLVRSIHTTVAGELLDVAASSELPGRTDALLVAELKTATYTCVVPLLAGAALAGASAEARDALTTYGLHMGVAFQLVDDELGVLGDPAVTGKSVLSDLREGKRTHLVALAHALADDAQRRTLDAHLGRPDLDATDAARVCAVLRATGAVDALHREVDARVAAATVALDSLPAPLRDHLAERARTLVERSA